MKKRISSMVLALIMVMTLLPTTAFAATAMQKNSSGMKSGVAYSVSVNDGAASTGTTYVTSGDKISMTITGTPTTGYEFARCVLLNGWSLTTNDITPADMVYALTNTDESTGQITVTCSFTIPDDTFYNFYIVCEEPVEPVVTPTPSVSLTATSDEYTSEYDSSNYRFVAAVTNDDDNNAALTEGTVQFSLNGTEIGDPVSYSSSDGGFGITIPTGDNVFYDYQFAMGDNTVNAVYTWTDETTTATSSDVTFTLTKKDISSAIAIAYTTSTIYYDGYGTNTRAQVNVDSNQTYDDFDVDDVTITATLDGAEHTLSSTRKTDTWMTFSLNDAGTYVITISVADENTYYTGTQSQEVTVNPLVAELEWSDDSVAFDGTEQEVTVTVTNKITGDTFEPTYTGNTGTNKGDYSASVTDLGNSNYTLEGAEDTTHSWSITQSATDFGDNGIVADQADKTYTYGETMTFTVTPEATGEEPEDTGDTPVQARMSMSYEEPTTDQMALYATIDGDEIQLCAPVTAGENGTYELTYDTTDKFLAVGTHTITAKYVGNDNMADYSETIDITIEAKPITATVATTGDSITKAYDGTAAFDDVALTLTENADGTIANTVFTDDDVSATANGTRATATVAGDDDFTATEITLTGADKDFYSLATTAVTGDVAITSYDIGTTSDHDSSITAVMGNVMFTEPSFDGVTVDEVTEVATGTVAYTYNDTPYADYDALIVALNGVTAFEDTVISVGYTFTASGNYTGTKTGTLTVTLNAADPVYAVSGNTITVTYDDAVAGIISISAPTENLVYGDTTPEATIVKTGIFKDETIEITYTKDGETVATPSDAGTYVASVTVGDVTAEVSFTISRASATFSIENNSFEFEATPTVAVSSENGLTEDTDYTVKYLDSTGAEVELNNETPVGIYTVQITVTNSNYKLSGTVDSVLVYEGTPATYTVSFGEDATALVAANAGTVRTLPTPNENTGYTFTGWGYNGKIYAAGASFTQPEENVTMTATWVENTYKVSGTVTNKTGDYLNGIDVTLDRTTVQTDASGYYEFTGVAQGGYELSATDNTVTSTVSITVTDDTVVDKILLDITLTAAVEVEADLTNTTGDMSKVMAAVADNNEYASGDEVEIKLVVSSANDTTAEEKIAEASSDVGYVLDLTVKESVTTTTSTMTGDVTTTTVSNLSETADLISVTIDLPAEMQGMAYYTVLRYHDYGDGPVVETLTINPNSDGECIELIPAEIDGVDVVTALTIHAKFFSTYAVTSSDTVPSSGSSSSSTYSSSVASTDNGTASLSSSKNKMNATVTVTATPDDGYEVESVTVTYGNDREVSVTDNGDGTYSYKQPGATATVTVTFAADEDYDGSDDGFFTDVDEDDWFYDAVKWAVDAGVTTGKSDTIFAPNDINTRAEAVTFLYRAMGEPEWGICYPFADVDADIWYTDAVYWAKVNGITQGTSEDYFSPDLTCTRAHIITFLWRMAGEPEVELDDSFADVAEDAYYAQAVAWAVGEGITEGTSDTTFSPDKDCTRAEIVTFLYRYLG